VAFWVHVITIIYSFSTRVLCSDLASARHFRRWRLIFESDEYFLYPIRHLNFQRIVKKCPNAKLHPYDDYKNMSTLNTYCGILSTCHNYKQIIIVDWILTIDFWKWRVFPIPNSSLEFSKNCKKMFVTIHSSSHFAISLSLSNICHVTSRKLGLPQCIMRDDLHIMIVISRINIAETCMQIIWKWNGEMRWSKGKLCSNRV
jgi:hypothetical protein